MQIGKALVGQGNVNGDRGIWNLKSYVKLTGLGLRRGMGKVTYYWLVSILSEPVKVFVGELGKAPNLPPPRTPPITIQAQASKTVAIEYILMHHPAGF
jgi:hypothetical protein